MTNESSSQGSGPVRVLVTDPRIMWYSHRGFALRMIVRMCESGVDYDRIKEMALYGLEEGWDMPSGQPELASTQHP